MISYNMHLSQQLHTTLYFVRDHIGRAPALQSLFDILYFANK